MQQDLRKKAITLYLKAESPKSIFSQLNRSQKWFFKWLRRYQTGDPDGYKDKSRAPKSQPAAIKWELSKSGYGFPSDPTINRVLKKAGRVK